MPCRSWIWHGENTTVSPWAAASPGASPHVSTQAAKAATLERARSSARSARLVFLDMRVFKRGRSLIQRCPAEVRHIARSDEAPVKWRGMRFGESEPGPYNTQPLPHPGSVHMRFARPFDV